MRSLPLFRVIRLFAAIALCVVGSIVGNAAEFRLGVLQPCVTSAARPQQIQDEAVEYTTGLVLGTRLLDIGDADKGIAYLEIGETAARNLSLRSGVGSFSD